MKIAFDVGPVQRQPAGVGLYASETARALARRLPADELAFIGMREDATGILSDLEARTRAPGPYPAWVALRSAADAEAVGADAVHYSDGLAPLRRHGRGTVLAVHDLSAVRMWRTHRAHRWLRIPLVIVSPRLADLVIVPSRATADEVIRFAGVASRRIEVVPYAAQKGVTRADDQRIASTLPQYRLEAGGYILTVGTLEPRKNHVRLLRAFEELVRRHAIPPNMKLVVAGKPGWGSRPILQAFASSPIADRIQRLGYVPVDDLSAILSGAAAVAYVSLYEGFGLPVVEALACGAPTVTSNVSSMPEVAGEAGFLVDPFDVGNIARGLEDAIAAGATEGEEIRRRGEAQAGRFSWDIVADRIAELYGAAL